MHTLVLIRHAKSDWSAGVSDVERPLSSRGRRQAPAVGRWLTRHLPPPDLVVVSTATRARQTWDLVGAQMAGGPGSGQVRHTEHAYTFSASALGTVIADLPATAGVIALVGHNPAVQDLVADLSGVEVRITTAAVAVLSLPRWDAPSATLRAAGRPADGPLPLSP